MRCKASIILAVLSSITTPSAVLLIVQLKTILWDISFSFFRQIKYAGSDTDFSTSPAFCKQIKRVDCEEQKVIGTQIPLQQLLEGLIADQELPAKDKRKRLKQVQTGTRKRN